MSNWYSVEVRHVTRLTDGTADHDVIDIIMVEADTEAEAREEAIQAVIESLVAVVNSEVDPPS